MIDDNWWKKHEKSGGLWLAGVSRTELLAHLRELYAIIKRGNFPVTVTDLDPPVFEEDPDRPI